MYTHAPTVQDIGPLYSRGHNEARIVNRQAHGVSADSHFTDQLRTRATMLAEMRITVARYKAMKGTTSKITPGDIDTRLTAGISTTQQV